MANSRHDSAGNSDIALALVIAWTSRLTMIRGKVGLC
jgi:hypothetical protein